MTAVPKNSHPQRNQKAKVLESRLVLNHEQSYQECLVELGLELQKEHPKKKTIKRLIKATFAGLCALKARVSTLT